MDFFQVDVFTEQAYAGNPLAVFPDASELDARQMQSIAREMNLSESIFVQAVDGDSYTVRIFTPTVELPFAGHPTIGCAWVLRSRGVISSDRVTQRSEAGETPIWFDGPVTWLRRTGTSDEDIERTDPKALRLIADALGIDPSQIGAETGELGFPSEPRPAFVDAGLRQLMVPVRDVEALQRCSPRADLFAGSDGWARIASRHPHVERSGPGAYGRPLGSSKILLPVLQRPGSGCISWRGRARSRSVSVRGSRSVALRPSTSEPMGRASRSGADARS